MRAGPGIARPFASWARQYRAIALAVWRIVRCRIEVRNGGPRIDDRCVHLGCTAGKADIEHWSNHPNPPLALPAGPTSGVTVVFELIDVAWIFLVGRHIEDAIDVDAELHASSGKIRRLAPAGPSRRVDKLLPVLGDLSDAAVANGTRQRPTSTDDLNDHSPGT